MDVRFKLSNLTYKMSLFKLKKHPKFPEEYEVCENTNTYFYRKAKERVYQDSYFMDEYKSQYKKTYYEDETNLRQLAKIRLQKLFSIMKLTPTNLLEIGSAAGFFLDESRALGFSAKGIELSNSEVEYSKNKLKLDVECISFFEFESIEKFSVIACFFVLEHLKEQEKALQKIFSLLDHEGYLLLALPSIFGPSYRTNTVQWFATHPEDHFVDYSPSSIKKTLNHFGADIVFMEPMSFHPQRDKGYLGKFPLKLFYKQIAKQINYGDTLFLIAKRRS